jgi:hypothetical protein
MADVVKMVGETLFGVFKTPSGFWDPIMWIFGFVVALVFVLIIRRMGESTCNRETNQGKPFLSGNLEESKDAVMVKSSNLYWGFMKSMESLYNRLYALHTGSLNDYILFMVFGSFIVGLILLVHMLVGGSF